MLDSKALTKIQSVALIVVILVAALGGVAIYVFWDGDTQSTGTIKIGICTDIGSFDDSVNGATLAAEQINAEGGILGKQIELVIEDTDAFTPPLDPTKASLAVTKLLTHHEVDFMTGGATVTDNQIIQELVAQHKKIFIGCNSPGDVLTEKVQNDYEKYKYFFKVGPPSEGDLSACTRDTVVALREYTGLNKVAYIVEEAEMWDTFIEFAIEPLAELHGFELVYGRRVPSDTLDFSSYFAGAEAAGTEILIPIISGELGTAFTEDWYERQSPMVMWGVLGKAASPDFWETTEGKCEHVAAITTALDSGYPISSKTLPMREAYIERWGVPPTFMAMAVYDVIRYILPDALERAGTLETEAVIKALEEVDLELVSTPRFAISADSHEIIFGKGYGTQYCFQWQANETLVPVYPREVKEQEGVTYTFPEWPGPWDDQ
ncbi:MAG: ABC transporter substrate-binding protein [Candidatus Bathyarchaeota archaeon]